MKLAQMIVAFDPSNPHFTGEYPSYGQDWRRRARVQAESLAHADEYESSPQQN
jgi:hypothetical protein